MKVSLSGRRGFEVREQHVQRSWGQYGWGRRNKPRGVDDVRRVTGTQHAGPCEPQRGLWFLPSVRQSHTESRAGRGM